MTFSVWRRAFSRRKAAGRPLRSGRRGRPELRTRLDSLEAQFLHQSGLFAGSVRHISSEDKDQITVDLISEEAFHTSEIEGKLLNRDSLQSSIRRNFGLATAHRSVPAAEAGVAEMMVDLYRRFDTPLTGSLLFRWHAALMNGRRDLAAGARRTGTHPMQVVSDSIRGVQVHFEAPLAANVPAEMQRFLTWYADTARGGPSPLPSLSRAAIAHLYLVCIHPSEDGNGRIGHAIAEKVLAEALGHASLIALSLTINQSRKAYYDMLERSNKGLEITHWLLYFATTILAAQAHAQQWVEFLIAKTGFSDRLCGRLNERQEKVLARMFKEDPKGFTGGLSAELYLRITGTSRATATRDLQDLVDKGALTRTGQEKSTRYQLRLISDPFLE